MKRTSPLAALALALACAACSAPPRAPAPAAAASSSPARALCLATPGAAAPDGSGAAEVDGVLKERREAVEKDPDKMALWVLLGRAWVEKARNSGDPGFYLHADACGQEVLAQEPDNVLALGLRSLALMNDHKFEDAKALAGEMLQKDRDDLTAWGTLSDAELELGHIDAAEKAAQEMMDRKPSLPSYARASYLKWLRGDDDGALEAIRLAYDAGRGQKDHEPSAWVLSEAAKIFWMRGDVAGAERGYDMALAEKADHPQALVGKARCLIAEGKAAQALPLLEEAWQKRPLVKTAWWVSKAHDVLGHAADKERWLQKAIDHGKEGDRRTLALVLATVNRDIPLAEQSVALDNAHRGGPYADDIAALTAWRAGDMKTALAASAHALSLGTPDPMLRLHRGVILAASGDASGKKLVADALAQGMRFDPSAVALAGEVGVPAPSSSPSLPGARVAGGVP